MLRETWIAEQNNGIFYGKLNAIAGQVARGHMQLQAVHSDDYSQKHCQNKVKMMNSQDNYEQ